MTRSAWKGPFVDGYLLRKAETARASGRHDMIKIWSRRSTILPQFVGLNFGVYNGQKHIRGNGRSQVRRVLADPDVLRPYLRP
jgi:small subunit ribosomal protein S19